jgi:ketosteroid isomerase-like protein
MNTEAIVTEMVAAYDARDLERVSAILADDLCYRINAGAQTGPYHADCQCKADFFTAIGQITADWDITSYQAGDMIVSGNRAAVQIDLTASSRHCAHHVTSRLALFLTVADGKVTEIIEYHDTALIGTAAAGA